MLRKATFFLFILVFSGSIFFPQLLWSAEKRPVTFAPEKETDASVSSPEQQSLFEKTYGDGPFELGPARTSEGASLIYATDATDLLEIDGNVAAIRGAGTAVVTVSAAGTDGDSDSEPGEILVTIQPAVLEVTADENQSKVYGDPDPRLTYSSEGFAYNDGTGLITGSLSRNAGENAGEYDILRGDLSAGGNYSVRFKSATFDIKQRELYVTAASQQSKIYGEPDPELEYSASNFANGDDASILSGGLSRAEGEDAGAYEISGNDLNAGGNYIIRFQAAEFTIEPRLLTLDSFTADDKIYDGSSAARGAGFQDNRLQEDQLEFSYSARFESPGAGVNKSILFSNMDIVGGSDRQNYILNTDGGIAEATIRPRPVTIQAKAAKMVYGDKEPALEYSISNGSLVQGDQFSGELTRTGSANAGSYEILQGSLSLGENYTISFQPASFTIIPRPLQVVVDENQSKVYGAPEPELTFKAKNFAPGEGTDIFTGLLSRGSAEDVGTYPIRQHTLRAGDNYTIDFSPAEFEIKPKKLVVVAVRHQTKRYGQIDPELRYTADGFAFDDSESILTGSLDRKIGENVGFYQIQKGDLEAGDNYTINYQPAEFEIMPRPLILTHFTAGDKQYDGTTDVSKTSFRDNRIEGDKLEFQYNAAFESPDAGQGKLVHFTDINITGGEDQSNYRLQTTSWSVLADITPRPITVTAQPVKLVYGDENPNVLRYKISSGSLLEGDKLRGELQRTGDHHAGVTEIRQGTLTAGSNYKLEFKPASYTINPKKLTVTPAGEPWKFNGQPDPEITYKVDGFEYEDDATSLKGSLGRMKGETPGEYQILQGSLTAGPDYKIDVVSGVFTIYRTPPVAIQRSPAADETRVGINDPVTIHFDKPINLEEADFITVTDPENRDIELGVEVEGNRVRLIHNEFVNYSTYTVTIGEGAVVNLDDIPNKEVTWQFTTIMLPPVVNTHSPADEAVGVGLSRPPVAAFNQSVKAGNLSGITIIKQDDGTESDVSAELDGNQLLIDHDGLEQFSRYRVTIPANVVQNADDVGNEPYSWAFTTIWAEPEQVVLELPLDRTGSVAVQPILKWKAALHADYYQVQVSRDKDFFDLIADSDISDGQKYEPSGVLENNQRYFWRVRAKNSTGQSDWSDIRSFVTVAETPVPVFPAADSDQISIAPLMEWSSNDNATFRVQLSQSDNFLNPETDQLTQHASVQLSGLKEDTQYFWRVRMEGGQTTSDWSEISAFRTRPAPRVAEATHVLREQIDFGDSALKIQSDASKSLPDFRLVSLPGEDHYAVSDLFDAEYGTGWKAFRKTSTGDGYREFRQNDRNFTFNPGGGFWVSGTKNLNLELPITRVETNKNDAYRIPLNPGWNIISNPHTKNVSWADVKAINDSRGTIFSYAGHFSEADTLRPVHAYYYYNPPETALDALEIPYSGMENRQKPDSSQESLLFTQGVNPPSVKLHAEFDKENRVTAEILFPELDENHTKSEQKLPRLKTYHPPMEMTRNGMMLLRPDTKIIRGLKRDVAVYNRQGSEYQLRMKASKGSVITWRAELSGMPDNTVMLLVNDEGDETWMLQHGKSVEVAVEESEMMFTLFVGDRYWLEQKEEEYLPEDFALYPNYPNPFNAATTIRYSLPVKQEVRLEIFDVIGRRVQVLINDEQPAGWHTMRFDASRLASGVYVYQMTTENNVTSRKMTIVK